MVIRKLLVLILILIFSCIPVNALEYDYNSSGTISYDVADSLSYSWSSSYGDAIRTWISSEFSHLFTDAKILNSVTFSSTSFWTCSLPYTKNEATPFTATVDSTYYGSGVVSVYEDESGKIFWDIDFNTVDESYASTLTGLKYVVVTCDDNPWGGVTSATTSRYVTTNAPGSNTPTQMMVSTNQLLINQYDVLVSYNTLYKNNYEYGFNSTHNLSSVSITRTDSSMWSVFDYNNTLYFEDDAYSTTSISQDFVRYQGVYANITFNVGGGYVISKVLDVNGTIYDEEEEDEDEDDFEYNITTELDEYSPGDTVNVTYTTDQKGTIQVVKTISGDIYHSIGFVSGATNATWQFYIAGNEPYGFYDVYLLDSSNSILDSVRYSLLPTTSSLDILQSSVDLHETFVVFAQTVNESILSIEDPGGVEVWNESIGALMYDYIYYTPTIKTGIYTAYLYDDSTLNDTVMVFLADPPIIDDPLDPETNGTIPIEDVLEDDETMTEYFDDKFREFAPSAWGIFLLSIILWLMAILTSFGGSSKRR